MRYYSKKLREIRKDKNMTLDELTEKSGVSRSTISAIEKGKHKMSVDTMCLLSKALDILPCELCPCFEENIGINS